MCVEEVMEVLQELLDFQGTRTVQLIFPEAEQHVNLKIKTNKNKNILSTSHRYKTACRHQHSNVQGAELRSHLQLPTDPISESKWSYGGVIH